MAPLSINDSDLLLLLVILRLDQQAYGVPISRELALAQGRPVPVGSVYAALDRLERTGAITSSLGESTPERGGRAKRYFRLTDHGLRAVQETRRRLEQLWQALPPLGEEIA